MMGSLLSRATGGKREDWDLFECCHILCLSYSLCPKMHEKEHAAGANALLVPKTGLVQLSVEEA